MFDESNCNEDRFFGSDSKPYLKRIPSRVDKVRGVQTFGADNLYPQRAIEVFKLAYTLKSAVGRYRDFTVGQGFVNKELNDIIVNTDGLGGTKLIDALQRFGWDYSFGDTIALHFNFNMLGELFGMNVLRQEYCRLGAPDDNGNVLTIKYSTNWEGDYDILGRKRVKVDTYPVFDPDPTVVLEQIDQAGGILNYKGQVLYLTPIPNEYAEVTFDAVLDRAQVQGDSGEYSVGITQNAFLGNTAVVLPYETESDEERKKVRTAINGKTGTRNAGRTIILESKDGTVDASKMFVNLGLPNSDKMFEYTDKNVRNAIRENYSMPMEILGAAPETGMFNQANIREAYNYYNSITLPRRMFITNLLNTIFAYWKDPVQIDFTIEPLVYTSEDFDSNIKSAGDSILAIQASVASGVTTRDSAIQILMELFNFDEAKATRIIGNPTPAPSAPGAASPVPGAVPTAPGQAATPPPQAATEDDTTGKPATNNILTGLTGKQNQNLKRVIREFRSGTTGETMTRIHLASGYGLTEEQISQIIEENKPDPVS